MNASSLRLWVGIWLAGAGAPEACAQSVAQATPEVAPRLRFGGLRLEPGIVSPENADVGFQMGGALSLGTIVRPWLHLNVAAATWSADIDRKSLGSQARGSVSDVVVSTDVRWEPLRVWRLRPYVLGGVAAHGVGANVPGDPSLEDALSGFAMGVDLGIGVRTNRSGFGGTLEARRRFVDNVDNWTFQLGVGYSFGGSPHYRQPSAGIAPPTQTVIVPGGAPGGTVTLASPVTAAAPARRSGAESETLERIARAMRTLSDENRALRADVDSLRRVAIAPPIAPASEPVAPPRPAASSVAPQVSIEAVAEAEDPHVAFGEALGRIRLAREHPDAVRESAAGHRLALAGTFAFESNRTTLSTSAREALRQVALVMFRFPDVTVRIEGHADAWGRPAANEKISLDRAEAVREELARLGIAAVRMAAVGLGSAHPIADNRNAEGRATNRRVEIEFEVER